MLILVALIGALLVGLLVWKAIAVQRTEPTHESGAPTVRRSPAPDDDPDFLRKLDERFKRDEGDSQPPR
jgi:hypothetical protein